MKAELLLIERASSFYTQVITDEYTQPLTEVKIGLNMNQEQYKEFAFDEFEREREKLKDYYAPKVLRRAVLHEDPLGFLMISK